MSRATRRKNNCRKAKRKEWIVHHVYGWPEGWYNNLHEYSNGKIHCSCPLCASKTRNKRRSRRNMWQPAVNWTIRDLKQIMKMGYEDYDENS